MSHTIHLLLIEAETPDEAFRNVLSRIDDNFPSWSDWSEVTHDNVAAQNFAGRWSGEVFLTSEQRKALSEKTLDTSTIPNFLRYADDQELADEVISQFLSYRNQALQSAVDNYKMYERDGLVNLSQLVKNYNPYAPETFTTREWYCSKILEIMIGTWNSDSHLYDLHFGTISVKAFMDRCSKEPEKQFLIPVDFHH